MMTRVTNHFNSQGSTSAHAYEHLPGEKPKMHPGAGIRHRKHQAELDAELAAAPVPPFTAQRAPYHPGTQPMTYAEHPRETRYYANAAMHAT